jgi:hypothetical protein
MLAVFKYPERIHPKYLNGSGLGSLNFSIAPPPGLRRLGEFPHREVFSPSSCFETKTGGFCGSSPGVSVCKTDKISANG